MSTLKTTNLQSSDASSANIILGQGSGGGATISGVTTSSTLRATTGIVTTATITTADVTTSRTTTGITTTATIDTATVGGVTTLNSDGVSCTGISTAKTFVPTEGQLSHRNLVINGAMTIAQRGTSSTSAGYQTVDRFTTSMAGTDEACTWAQGTVAADTDPWNAGFRNTFKVTNGNQTSGAGAADDISMSQNIESQTLAKSGWDYTSSSSYITLSFWAKSSVAQTFYTGFRIYGSDQREYCFAYTLAANTWKKVTHAIPGGSGHTIVDSTAIGAFIQWPMWWGGNYTSSGRALNTWQVKNNASNYPDNTSTWYTTNDATFELTGVQLEVGSAATPFEHRSYGDELTRCQRYYQRWTDGYLAGNSQGADINIGVPLAVPLRAAPTIAGLDMHRSGNQSVTVAIAQIGYTDVNATVVRVRTENWTSMSDETVYTVTPSSDTMELTAEL